MPSRFALICNKASLHRDRSASDEQSSVAAEGELLTSEMFFFDDSMDDSHREKRTSSSESEKSAGKSKDMKETPVPPPLPNSNQNLNDLPQEVLVYILSFLPTIEAIQTSLISRKWRNLWFFLTSFNFSFETCFPYFDNPLPFYTRRMTRPFANFVDRALTTRPADPAVHSFRLSFIYDSDYEVRVESWIRTAVTHLQARELHLDFYIDYDYDFSVYKYEFFFSELRNGCVQVLKLTSCNITLPDDMDLGLLRSMFLDQVNLEDEEVRKLFSGCPNLEHFELRNCLGVKGLFIRSTKLKKLALGFVPNLAAFSWNTTEIEIDCPNLLSLSFTECDFNQFVLKKAAALVELSIHLSVLESEDYHLWRRTVRLLLQAPNVKKLKVPNLWIMLLTSRDLFPTSFKLQSLNHLELGTGYSQKDLLGMVALLGHCPNLKTMVLYHLRTRNEDEKLPEGVLCKLVEFTMPRIKLLKMRGYFRTQDVFKFVTMLRRQGVVAEKIVVDSPQM
ncbi:F-box/LRR-repeat protein At4g14103-like [Rosa chinensis]|uniref:F-box/LRR-repeat protein At4g14103-like n=1 Tax=Rosa chinensis TaxID=74649 RepID=UPI001AD9374F|nr:F-box/LRR-repeat protein At4g14103-like [Rosa chinensis]